MDYQDITLISYYGNNDLLLTLDLEKLFPSTNKLSEEFIQPNKSYSLLSFFYERNNNIGSIPNTDNHYFEISSAGFWSAAYWLPKNNTWDDVPVNYSKLDLIYPILLAIPILLARFCIENTVGFILDYVLECAMKKPCKHNTQSKWKQALIGFSANATSTPLQRKKLLENFYRVFAYTVLFAYGVFVLYDKEWMYDVNQCWESYPNHTVDATLWWYYMIQIAFYTSLSMSCVFDHRRSDFFTTVIHHVVTIGLLYFSWWTNFVRIGAAIVLLHDLSDLPLEYTKLLRYSKCKPVYVNVAFILFLLSWIATRIIYFPTLIFLAVKNASHQIYDSYSSLFNPIVQPYGPRIMISLLFVLLSLHIFWTYLIIKVIKQALISGETNDVRSDISDNEDFEINIQIKEDVKEEDSNDKINIKTQFDKTLVDRNHVKAINNSINIINKQNTEEDNLQNVVQVPTIIVTNENNNCVLIKKFSTLQCLSKSLTNKLHIRRKFLKTRRMLNDCRRG